MTNKTKNKNRWILLFDFCVLLTALLLFYFCTQPEVDHDNSDTKRFTLEITHQEGDINKINFITNAEYLGEFLLDEEIISGEESVYGLYVLEVDGEEADYNTDGAYWAFYINGEYATQGVSQTLIHDGDLYAFVYTTDKNQ